MCISFFQIFLVNFPRKKKSQSFLTHCSRLAALETSHSQGKGTLEHSTQIFTPGGYKVLGMLALAVPNY